MIDHDIAPGRLDRCQVCGCADLELVIDVGHQPLCDSLLTAAQLDQPETSYPLRLFRCPACTLTQLDYVVDGSVVYAPEYPYRSGITRELRVYQEAFADGVIARVGLPEGSLCIDIGSNDGTLLTGFKRRGMQALGVEPTNIARIARAENGVETIQSFFTEALASEIVRDYGPAKVMTATNVFAHMAPLGEVMRGIVRLLDTDGVFITESHYLLDVLHGAQYDTVYHEHIRTYSLKSLVCLFEQYGLDVFEVQRADRYGGNIRAYVCRKGTRPIAPSVRDLLDLEAASGLGEADIYTRFRENAFRTRDDLMEFAYRTKREGRRLVGNSCPGRCSTLLNFCGMTPELLPYLAEQPTSLKLGMYLPGRHIPIVENSILIEEQPDFVLLLAWHYARPISEQLRERGLRSKFVMPLPTFGVRED
ncbi:MAG: class I SAM-dependent methyltransferase [Pseudomonadota bacterium]|nr:class I SAM-dependent methyltransferase [Pseudomonadota bacterium]